MFPLHSALPLVARRYVLKKSLIRTAGLRWYDWQFWSVFPYLFFKFGSLRRISQEPVEAQMALNNQTMARSNSGANTGRITNHAKETNTVKEYLEQRKKRKRSLQRWLYERQVLNHMSAVHTLFERIEARRARGAMLPYDGPAYTTAYVPAMRGFKHVAPLAIKVIASSRARGPDRPHLTALADAVTDYYAPFPPEKEAELARMEPERRRVVRMKLRKARWQSSRGEESGRQLLHTELRLAQLRGEQWPAVDRDLVLRMFGRDGRFPMGCGRERGDLE